MKNTHAKFHNNQYKTVRGVARIRDTNFLYIKGEKVTKNDPTIISNPHAQYTMKKTYAKFQNDLKGVAFTRGTQCLYIEGEK